MSYYENLTSTRCDLCKKAAKYVKGTSIANARLDIFLVCDMRNLSNTSIKNIRYVGVNAVTIYVKYMRVSNVDKILQKVEILNVGDIASVEN